MTKSNANIKPVANQKPTAAEGKPKKEKKAPSALRVEIKQVAQDTGLPLSFVNKKVTAAMTAERQAVKDLSAQLRAARAALREGPVGRVKAIAVAGLAV